jgi:hypothetical protein
MSEHTIAIIDHLPRYLTLGNAREHERRVKREESKP